MPTTEVVLRPGDTLTLKLEVGGQAMRLDLALTGHGVAVRGPVAAKPAPQPVDLTEEFDAEPEPVKPASLAAVEPLANEPVRAVDVSFDEEPQETGTEESAPATVQDGGDDIDLDLGDLEGDLEEQIEESAPAQEESEAAPMIDIPGDDSPLLDSDGGLGDDGFNADGMTMLPPTRKGAEAKPLEAISATLQPLSLQDPSTDAMADTGDPDMGDKSKFAPSKDDTLPVWTGKARDYKDPLLEKKKQTGVINKAGMQKPATGPVKPGMKPAGKPAPAPAPAQEDDGLSLSLEDESPAPAAAPAPAAKPALGKPLPGKKPTGPINAPKPAAAASGKSAAAASGKAPAAAAEGDFTVFLSPPKGADKKQQAAEIIAEIQGISVKDALALAGKMIVPVVKGVTEKEAHNVRDKFKDAGLSCRITQKR